MSEKDFLSEAERLAAEYTVPPPSAGEQINITFFIASSAVICALLAWVVLLLL